MTSLSVLVPPLKRAVAVPGEFAATFPNTQDSDLIGVLGDAFGQAQIDGFFGQQVLDLSTRTITPDLSSGGSAVIGLYAAEDILMSKFRSVSTRVQYKAGPVEYLVDNSANVVSAQLKIISERRKELVTQALRLSRSSTPAVYVKDAYLTRSYDFLPWFGGYVGIGLGDDFGFWNYELTRSR